jgi:cytochrome bd-type quinol oxidase subunit 2
MFEFFWRHRSDEEHIERLRRTMKTWDRWRPWFIVIHSLALVAFLAITIGIAEGLNRNWPNNPGPVWLGFLLGIPAGGMVGMVAHKIAHGFVWAIAGHRSEHLLLRYYDAVQTIAVARNEIMHPRLGSASSGP